MITKIYSHRLFVILFLGSAVFLTSTEAYAGHGYCNVWGKRGHHKHHYPKFRKYHKHPHHFYRPFFRSFRHHHHQSHYYLPEAAVALAIAGATYYFLDGLFYHHTSRGYVTVEAPYGAVVKHIPKRRKEVWIRGECYYYCDNTYYKSHHRGYVVVANPYDRQEARRDSYEREERREDRRERDRQRRRDITIQVPNRHGGTTPVTIREKGRGYVGPEGEYYEDFPKISELKKRYRH